MSLLSGNKYLMGGQGKYLKTSEIILTLAGDGVWTWFIDPRGVYYNGKTYFGYVNSGGDIEIKSFNHSTRLISSATILHATLEVDDHDNPSILIRDSDKKILAFYSKHAAAPIYLRISSNSEDISIFESEVNLDSQLGGNFYTYPNPLQLLGEVDDPVYLFFRHHASVTPPNDFPEWSYSKSTDGGATWAAKTDFFTHIGNRSPYFRIVQNGDDRIDFAVSDAHPVEDNGSIYHFYYQGGNWYETDGTQIVSALPLDSSDITLVYDGTTIPGWVWDIAIDAGGNPVIVFATFPSITDHRYQYAKWNGSSWIVNEITAAGGRIADTSDAGQDYYSGGVVLDQSDPNIVYLSKYVNGQFEIYKYTTSNGGITFTERAITGGSSSKNIRPVSIRNHTDDLRILWLYGTYVSYTNYNMVVKSTSI